MRRRHTIRLLVNDSPGVLQRVAGLLSRRGFNIDSITVGGSEQEGISRMVVILNGEPAELIQMCRQAAKLIDVIEVVHLNPDVVISRELLLVKLSAKPNQRQEILSMVETFRCAVIDVAMESVIIQIVGDEGKNNALLRLLEPYGIIEITRTGETAMERD
ncbi:acetolactate synthase small subunit [Paenibacillus sp. GD4]|uniref:acetolactate synthase small subunit n=1 Tax=Paenibacillus sp. GD4 TaxID=3068890 RepID=UPI002796CBC7|nr:acetolactate synthase small subunit [Paenibacillus sp. GD4]MDQ1911344.1 acetolactate synthase small subunit [Paenibacillus sp. GD4]